MRVVRQKTRLLVSSPKCKHAQESDVETVIQTKFVVPSGRVLRTNLPVPSPMLVDLIQHHLLCPTLFGCKQEEGPAPIRTKRVILVLYPMTPSVCEDLKKVVPL
jgi:hypothetical protein